jgi:hypothetical protein
MTIIKTTPFTPADLAVLEEKHSDVGIKTLVGFLSSLFFVAIFSIVPSGRGQHKEPSLYENYGIQGLMILATMLFLGAILMYFINKHSIEKDIKSGLKTIATVEIREKIMGLENFKVFTKEEEPFKSFVVSQEIYHKVRKGDLITVEFAYVTQTIFDIKMPY